MNKMNMILGIIFLIIGIWLSVMMKEPHFYTFFSTGLFLIGIEIYHKVSKKKLFDKWKIKNHLFFWISLTLVSILIDLIGMNLGYWKYQYNSLFDEVIKYIFEWVISLAYIMTFFMIGMKIYLKKFSNTNSIILSLLTFSILIGIFTEFINTFSNSWTILKMPIINTKIGDYFVTFQTLGYWLMSLIPFFIYKISGKIK